MEVGKLTVEVRSAIGHKGASRQLRTQGKVPGVCYGASVDGKTWQYRGHARAI